MLTRRAVVLAAATLFALLQPSVAAAETGPPPAAGPTSVAASAGDGAMVVSWEQPAPGATSHVATATAVSGAGGGGSCVATTERFCTIRGLANGTAYRVAAAGRNADATGPATAAPGFTVPRGRCTPQTPGPPNPALAAAITARLAADPIFAAVFGAELNRLAPCNPIIDRALRNAVAAAIASDPAGPVATAIREAMVLRAQVQEAIARDPNGELARRTRAALAILAPVVTWPAWVRSAEGNYVADGVGATFGQPGARLVRYTVEVHQQFRDQLGPLLYVSDAALGDAARGWIANGSVRLQRINDPAQANIRIVIEPPAVVDYYCGQVGLDTEGWVSCWDGRRTNLNSDRWFYATGQITDLSVYRTYLVNHEFGHGLGYGHQYCPAPGALAPVMQQQTYGLQGCRANGWPYP